jgi:hypothetical protein
MKQNYEIDKIIIENGTIYLQYDNGEKIIFDDYPYDMLHIFPLTDNEKLEIESLKYIFGRNLTYFMKLIDAKLYFRKKGFFLIIQHDTPYLMSTSKYQEYRIHTIDNIKIKLTKSNTPYIMYDFFGFNEPYEKKDIEKFIKFLPEENVIEPEENVIEPEENVLEPLKNVIEPLENIKRKLKDFTIKRAEEIERLEKEKKEKELAREKKLEEEKKNEIRKKELVAKIIKKQTTLDPNNWYYLEFDETDKKIYYIRKKPPQTKNLLTRDFYYHWFSESLDPIEEQEFYSFLTN